MVLQLDVDGVLANFTEGFHALLLREFPELKPLWAREGFVPGTPPDFWDDLPPHVTEDMSRRVWQLIWRSQTFWEELSPLAAPEEFLRLCHLGRRHIPLYFVTSRVGATAKHQTEVWLGRHMPGVIPTVIISHKKADAALAVGATHVLDDKLGNALAVYYNAPSAKVYLKDTSYNSLNPKLAGRGVRRVKTVGEFLADVEGGR